MRRSNEGSGGRGEYAVYPVSPVLVHYGGEAVPDGYGWTSYKCPFHGDSDASGSVNTMTQVFNCHAADCPKGSATQIIMKMENCTYVEAVERAEAIAGAGDAGVRRASGRSSRMAGGSRNRSGTRAFKRTWRSD